MNEDYILDNEQYKEFISRITTDLIKINYGDMAEVIRCKNCVRSEQYKDSLFCNRYDIIVNETDYCSFAEAKNRGVE